MLSRRQLLLTGLGAAAGAATPAWAASQEPRSLSLFNLHTGEALDCCYYDGGYLPDALTALHHLLRDHRTGEQHPLSPQLFDLLATISAPLGGKVVQVISGYRSPATNARLHAASSGVAKRSLHMEGLAMDVRIPGVALSRLRDAAWSLQRGGVGYYPGSNFVHIDVGRVRRWQG